MNATAFAGWTKQGTGYDAAKRVLDVVIAAAAMLILSPLLLVIPILIKLDSPGPVLHRASRLGKGGSTFLKYKFRTMLPHGETLLQELVAADERIRDEYRRTYKIRNDPRVTRVGKVLRRLSLDELPQFVNVLIGDMSVVGPRDILPQELEDHYAHCKDLFLSVKPGITGLWQVSGRSRLPYTDRVRLDMEYIRKRSLLLDLAILSRTIPAVLAGDGAE